MLLGVGRGYRLEAGCQGVTGAGLRRVWHCGSRLAAGMAAAGAGLRRVPACGSRLAAGMGAAGMALRISTRGGRRAAAGAGLRLPGCGGRRVAAGTALRISTRGGRRAAAGAGLRRAGLRRAPGCGGYGIADLDSRRVWVRLEAGCQGVTGAGLRRVPACGPRLAAGAGLRRVRHLRSRLTKVPAGDGCCQGRAGFARPLPQRASPCAGADWSRVPALRAIPACAGSRLRQSAVAWCVPVAGSRRSALDWRGFVWALVLMGLGCGVCRLRRLPAQRRRSVSFAETSKEEI